VDVLPVIDQVSKAQRRRRAADLELQGHCVVDPLLNRQLVRLPE